MERLKIVREDAEQGCGPSCGCAAEESGSEATLNLDDVRRKLEGKQGPRFWRSLEELAETPGFQELMELEFPRQAMEPEEGFSRRRFLQLSSASVALAGLSACTRQPEEMIIPYVRQPEQLVPGKPLFFATATSVAGYGVGLLAESHMGRPTKVEGNEAHPASLGGTDAMAQATILSLYDPDRVSGVSYLEQTRTWNDLAAAIAPRLDSLKALGGDGLWLLTEPTTSPTFVRLMDELRAAMPQLRWVQYAATGRSNVYSGAERAFGEGVEVHYDLSKADVIVCLDSDLLTAGPAANRYARQWADRRRVADGDTSKLNRLYSIESTVTNTGTVADHRMAIRPSQVGAFAAELAAEVGVAGAAGAIGAIDGSLTAAATEWAAAIARDLAASPGRSLVVAGDEASPAVHVLAHAMNELLGNLGETAIVTEAVVAEPGDQVAALKELVEALNAGTVDTLMILGGNPVFDAPSDLRFAEALPKAAFRVRQGLETDETSGFCEWQVGDLHFLEGWGDVRAFDGSASIVQPLIQPLFGGKSSIETLALLLGQPTAKGYDLVQATWEGQLGGVASSAWRQALHNGVVANTEAVPRAASVAGVGEALADLQSLPPVSGFEVMFRADPSILDGRYANNVWLQELPRPSTKLTWDNAALMSPATIEALGLELTDSAVDPSRPMVSVQVGSAKVDVPVWSVIGHPDDCVTLNLGYGRKVGGRNGTGVGFDVYPLRTQGSMDWAPGSVAVTGENYRMATTQHHFSVEGRELVRVGTKEEFDMDPHFVEHRVHEVTEPNAYKEYAYDGAAWGLVVDLNTCTGCNACVIACQSENNIPVVGKEQVIRGREMHWMRIDRYFEGDPLGDGPLLSHSQPVMCMQCEQAPCELVCPVAATVHTQEGLNDMVYNRCVGTRYCSNNCPYKVRRFNFLKYTDHTDELQKMYKNPDVTIRMRGVMEKCTYCTQRISAARVTARVEHQRGQRAEPKVRDGEVVTACQQACPSGAIVFGDLNDSESKIAKLKASPLNYSLLAMLGTKPRTTYLAKVRNPNPELETSHHGGH